MSNAALFKAKIVISGSVPRSKRKEASVFSPCRLDVLRTETELNHALSKKIFLVSAFTPEPIPPKTPAMHMGISALQIIRSSAESLRSTSSRVLNKVPSSAFFTMTLPPIMASALNACKGCPRSCKI